MMEAGILVMFAVVGGGILALACLAAWIWALIDILKNEFIGPNKLVWLLLVILPASDRRHLLLLHRDEAEAAAKHHRLNPGGVRKLSNLI